MPAIDEHSIGSFCWAELATNDIDSALVFYSTVFGWDIEESDIGDHGRYIRCRLKGRLVAAVCELSKAQLEFASPPIWHSYVRVADVAEHLERAVALGGQQFEGPINVPNAGILGTVIDPGGGLLCLWQSTGFNGCQWGREIGAPVWNELWTRAPKESAVFYDQLLRWQSTNRNLGDTEYTSFAMNGQSVGGLMTLDETLADLPSRWMVYFAVARCEDTLEAATALDATVRVPPTDLPGIGRFAVLNDPQGGTFCIIQMFDLSQ